MTSLIKIPSTIKWVSKQRPKSLILRIPAAVRDIMEFEHGTSINIEVCLDENDKKFVKISKED